MKDSPAITSFNGGELSPFIAGRVDVAKYANGCERMEGFIPLVEGPAISCPGFRFVAEVKDSGDRTWLVRFEFSSTEAWMLEFGDQYIRFYTNRGQVQSGGAPYAITSPYTAIDLTNPDGSFALRYAQTGDVVYLVHADYPPYKLVRTGATAWTITAVDFDEPPFADMNTGTTTVYASAATGSVTLTASANLFTSAHVGRYIKIEPALSKSDGRWEASKRLAVNGENTLGLIRRAAGNWYSCASNLTAAGSPAKGIFTGTVMPTHTEGVQADGDGGAVPDFADTAGVDWEYMHSGYGIAKITAYTNATTVTATVLHRIPANAVTNANPTTRWSFGAWDATQGYPTCVSFFRERLVFSRGATVWFSVAGDFENFATKIGGVQTADAGFDKTIASGRLNAIKWLAPGDVLLAGTLGDEYAIAEQTNGSAFSNANCKIEPQSVYGSSEVDVSRVGDGALFVQRGGKTLRSASFSAEKNRYLSDDVTAFASHILQPGVIDMAFQMNPWRALWCALGDGTLAGLVFNVEQNVVAWFRRPITGAVVECVEVIPAPGGERDDLWIIARMTVNGATKRYIAYLEAEEDADMAQEDWFYVDMGATYSGAPATTISGLSYLEGKSVWVLADGANHPAVTVSGGSITLQTPASKVQVGLPNPGYLQPMPINAGAPQPAGKIKRIHAVVLRVLRSLGGRAGPDVARASEIRYRLPSVPMGSAPPAFTGDVEIEWDGDYDRKQTLLVIRDKPMPMTLIAVMPELHGSDGR